MSNGQEKTPDADEARRRERLAENALMATIAAKGDPHAFAQIFSRYAPRLKYHLLKQGSDDAQAEEIVQDVLSIVWTKAHLFDPQKSSLATWLYRIARNRRIDLSRRQRGTAIPLDGFDAADDTIADPGEGLDALSRAERTRRAVKNLPEEQRQMIELSFEAGLTHMEIAQRTGLALGTVKSRIRLAFAKLKRILESDPAVDPLA